MPELPTGTVTFLFTDIEGSTRLIAELGEEGYATALAEHRRVVREACERNGGVEVDTQGDAFFVAFATAPQALAAAGEAQEALSVPVRMGIHTGTPLVSGEVYVGADVHKAARIAAAGHGGQIVLSATTAALLDGDLTELGEHRLEDFDESIALFQLGCKRFAPLKTISNTNLPRPASSFVGRERELAGVTDLLRGGARLVTLCGPGGSGKTRLAIEAASELVPEFNAGVFWIPLAAVRDPMLVTETIAHTLGAKDGLAAHIGERDLLLLLDNLEQVVEAATELATLVETCPGLHLITTSRELLRVRGEVEFAVPPLADAEALELFCTRAQLEPAETIAELCRRLDNLPLAVELAAARARVLSPPQILDRLSKRLDLLKGGRDAEARQQTLRAAIEWSYDLLDEEEQQLFMRLSVFAGGCTLEAAEEVAEAELDVLQSLVDKNLLRHRAERFSMLETIRSFAREVSERHGESASLCLRHAHHYLAFAQATKSRVSAPDRRHWVDLRAAELDNLREALAWSVESGSTALAQELVIAFSGASLVRTSELRAWLQRVLDASGDGDPVLRARVLKVDGYAALVTGDYEAARARLTESLGVVRDAAPDAEVADALAGLAEIERITGRFSRARVLYNEAIEVADRCGARRVWTIAVFGLAHVEFDDQNYAVSRQMLLQLDVDGFIWPLQALGDISMAEGDLDEAVRRYRRCLERARQEAARRVIAYALAGLAAVASRRGDSDTAGRLWGTVEMLNEVVQPGLMLHDESRYSTYLEDLWNDPTFAKARTEGQELSVDEAVALGLGTRLAGSSGR